MLLKRASDPGYLHKNGSQIGKLKEKIWISVLEWRYTVAKLEWAVFQPVFGPLRFQNGPHTQLKHEERCNN